MLKSGIPDMIPEKKNFYWLDPLSKTGISISKVEIKLKSTIPTSIQKLKF